MGRRSDLEDGLRQSYQIVAEYEAIERDSDRPEERQRAARMRAGQWRLIEPQLTEYLELCRRLGEPPAADLAELAAARRAAPPAGASPGYPAVRADAAAAQAVAERRGGPRLSDRPRDHTGAQSIKENAVVPNRRHVVLLLHGIRTQAEWTQRTAAILERDPEIRARPVRYEFFDALRFLLPLNAIRERPIRRLTGLLRDELSRNPDHLSIIAHSFGTFILSRIFEREPDICFHRIVLAGSIIPDDFNWSQHGHRLDPDADGDWQAVNDCGMRDLWPVLAKSVTWGYGSSGRFGFGHVRVKDRFFDLGHSDFFKGDFVATYWAPYLSEGRIVEGVLDRPTNPWWVSVLTVLKLKYFALLFILASIVLGAYHLVPIKSPPVRPPVTSTPDLDTAMNRALGLLASGRIDEAIPAFEYVTRTDPRNSRAYSGLGYALEVRGRLDEAIKADRRAIQLDEMNVEAHWNLGNALYGKGDYEGAASSHRRALQISPDYTNAYYGLGNALMKLGRVKEAQQEFEKARDPAKR
jgi:cytochrome c-type biogenesis protein CcmH/NrfG